MPILSIKDQSNNIWKEIPTLKGSSATVKVGQVSTVMPDQQASVTNSGDSYDAVLDFEIPRGVNGITPVRGQDYWTAEDQAQIIKDVEDKINYSFGNLMEALQGKSTTYILDDKAQLDSVLDLQNNSITYNDEVKKLNPGDIFLLKSTDEPDYWFGEDPSGEKLHELDSRKIDLTDYFKKEQIQVKTLEEYDSLASYDPNTFYFIIEEDIDASLL